MKTLVRIGVLILLLFSQAAFAEDRVFTVPSESLKTWSQGIIISLDKATITGASKVHNVKSDCEMHFGAKVNGYKGDPDGWVLEPMNVCIEPYFKKKKQANADWIAFAKSLEDNSVVAKGVLRIWPEHLVGGNEPSNPNHALELHPLTQLKVGSSNYDFTKFIYAPEGFPGGLSSATAQKILEDIEVNVTTTGDDVEISFDAGRIGNFSTLDLSIDKDSIQAVAGGHRMAASVVFGAKGKKSYPVTLVTVEGTKIDEVISTAAKAKSRHFRIEGLVLFSLDPVKLYEAAKTSDGNKVVVKEPIQLILYGEAEAEE